MSMPKKDQRGFFSERKILKLCEIYRAISRTDSKNCLTRFLSDIRIIISVKDTRLFLFSWLLISFNYFYYPRYDHR